MVFFQQQAKEMGFNPERYGLEIVSEDLEGADYRETEKNTKNVSNFIKKSYEGQFGKKNNAVQTAQDAETRAYSNIKIAKSAFARNHKGVEFAPENLGARPNFMDPKYKDNLTKYVSDLNAWAQDVAHAYQDADSMSNEQLAAMIMQNSDDNAAFNAGVTVATADEVIANDNENAAILYQQGEDTQQAVREEGQSTRKAVHAEGAATRKAVHQEGAATRRVVREEGAATRKAVSDAAQDVKDYVGLQHELTRDRVTAEAELTREDNARQHDYTRSVVRDEGEKTRQHNTNNTVLTSKRQAISDTLGHEDRENFGSYRDTTVRWIEQTADEIIADPNLTQKQKEDALDELNRMIDEENVISDKDKENFNRDYRGIDSQPSDAKPKRDPSKDNFGEPNPQESSSSYIPPNVSQPNTNDSGDYPNSKIEPDKRDA